MSLGGIVRRRREDLGATQELIAKQVGISKPYLSNIETGKARNPPSDGVLRSLERALNFRPGELLKVAHLAKTPADVRDEHERLVAENQKLRGVLQALRRGETDAGELDWAGVELDLGSNLQPISAGVIVPVINNVAAGYPHHFTDLDYPPSIADEYIRCPDLHDPQAFAARVVGDSMEPEYHEGDIVVFSPKQIPRSGNDCFVRLDEDRGTTFKRVYEDDKQTLRLQPLNNAYPAQTLRREQVTGLWPAVFRIQRLRQP